MCGKLIASVLASVTAIGTLGISGVVHARSGCEHMNSGAGKLVNSEVTIAQAIAIAEKHMDGEAIGTGREYANGTTVFFVEVLKYGQKRKVIVDLKSGQVGNGVMAGRCDI